MDDKKIVNSGVEFEKGHFDKELEKIHPEGEFPLIKEQKDEDGNIERSIDEEALMECIHQLALKGRTKEGQLLNYFRDELKVNAKDRKEIVMRLKKKFLPALDAELAAKEDKALRDRQEAIMAIIAAAEAEEAEEQAVRRAA